MTRPTRPNVFSTDEELMAFQRRDVSTTARPANAPRLTPFEHETTAPLAPLPSRPVVAVPILDLPAGPVPIDFTAPMRAHLDRMVDAIPPDKRGQARLIIDLTGVEADIAAKVNEHVEVSAAAGKQWSGGVYAGAQVRIVW